jgi:hypothetical protein
METTCKFCNATLVEDAQFCHMCGGGIDEQDPSILLGVKIEKSDIMEYLFKGYIQKTIDIGSGVKIEVKTLTQKEQAQFNIDADRRIADLRNPSGETVSSTRIEAHAKIVLVSLDGKTPPSDIGSGLAAIITYKSSLLEGLLLRTIQEGQIANF